MKRFLCFTTLFTIFLFSGTVVRAHEPAIASKMKKIELHHVLKGHKKPVGTLAFSSCGKFLASGDHSGRICLWNVATGKLVRTWDGHKKRLISGLVFFSDAKRLLSTGNDGYLALWNLDNGQREARVRSHQFTVSGLALSSDAKLIATHGNGELKLWKNPSLEPVKTYSGMWILNGFCRRDKQLIFTEVDFEKETATDIFFFDTTTEKVSKGFSSEDRPSFASFSRDGKSLVSCNSASEVVVWDVQSRKRRFRRGAYFPLAADISPDGQLVVYSVGATVVVNGYNGDMVTILPDSNFSMTFGVKFNPRGTLLATGHGDTHVRIWKVSR